MDVHLCPGEVPCDPEPLTREECFERDAEAAGLTGWQAEAAYLVIIDEVSHAKVAAIHGKSRQAVHDAVRRARHKLSQSLTTDC